MSATVGQVVREIRGLTVKEHTNRLGRDLIPLAELCGRVIRDALPALETLPARPEPGGRAIGAHEDLGNVRTARGGTTDGPSTRETNHDV
jgi:hypothetical protein